MSSNTLARITGAFYLLMAITSGFGLKVMEGFEADGPAAIGAHIAAGRDLYEIAIASSAIGGAAYLILALLLHRLFSPTGPFAVSLLAIFVVVSVAIWMIAIGKQLDVLSLVDGAHFGMTNRPRGAGPPVFSGEQLQTQLTLALYAYDNLIVVACLFWGLWLVPFGWLMFNAGGVAPKVLGVLLVLGGVAYVMSFLRPVLFLGFENALYKQVAFVVFTIPATLCELGTMLYLLIMGAPKSLRAAS